MLGDVPDMVRRLRSVLPAKWFADTVPVLGSVLSGLGAGWSAIYGLIATVRAQARIGSAAGSFLDMISSDFFGTGLPRRKMEGDADFRLRIVQEMLRPRGSRAALTLSLSQLTGRAPAVFEPAFPPDTGGYSIGGVGYGAGGGWGNLALPFQAFVTAYRPAAGGIALLGGYGTAGVPAYGDLSSAGPVVSDADIFAAAVRVLPTASTAWMRISA